ncbi:MAG: Acyl-CoA thioesterase-like protein [Acidimicrobiales bacterium]|nr:Acyl-CoA thioesterase-like protein [Acidimicrobiales bacterium]
MAQATKFERETAVAAVPGQSGRYHALLTEDWCTGLVPQGGIVAAVALRAMQAELGTPEHRLRSATTVFAASVFEGEVEIDITVLRRGRSMSQVQATLRNVGQPAGHATTAVFGTSRPGFEFTETVLPVVPGPDACPSFRDPPPEDWPIDERDRFRFWEQIEGRPAVGHAPWDDWEPTDSERVFWYRFEDTPRTADGGIDPLALVTLCDLMPGAVSERMGPRRKEWFGPSADLTVHLLGSATSDWLLAANRARHAGDGYATVECDLWDPATGLVAYATQVMFFAFDGEPPPPDQRRPPS